MCSHSRILKTLVAFAVTVLVTLPSIAAPGYNPSKTPGEYQVKAAFIYNFTRFINWPAETLPKQGGVIKICVVGENPFKGFIRALEGKKTKGMGFKISEVEKFTGGSELDACHIIFISKSNRAKLPAILGLLKGQSVLTISDITRFAKAGGVIGFTTKNKKVRLEVNLKAAERAKLSISSKLLKLMDIVER